METDANSDSAKMWNKQQVRNYLGISRGTLDRLIYSGELRAFKIGRVVRFYPSDVIDFLNGCELQPQTQSKKG